MQAARKHGPAFQVTYSGPTRRSSGAFWDDGELWAEYERIRRELIARGQPLYVARNEQVPVNLGRLHREVKA